MSKRKHKVPANGPVWHQSGVEATLAKMPKYNGYACGNGIHGDTKYNRNKAKAQWKRELDQSSLSCLS